MSIYQYKAIDAKGKVATGKLPAKSEAEMEYKLKQSGLDIISIKQIDTGSKFRLMPSVSDQEMILICIHFYHLEKAGVPILDSIGDLRDSSNNKVVREVMMDVYDLLRSGKTLSEALAQHPYIFDKIFIGLIRAGEKTGSFVEIFKHLVNHYRWISSLKKKIKKATYYPFFVLIVMLCVLTLMMVFVIPKLSAFLLMQKIELPFYTTLLIAISSFLGKYLGWIIGLPFFMYIVIHTSSKFSENVAYFFDLLKLKIPIIGNILKKIEVSRFCHFFALTYKSGVSILECLDIASSVLRNKVIKEAVLFIKDEVSQGSKLTQSVSNTTQFPGIVVRMFKVGEDSGNLDQALENINIFYDEEINTSIDNLVGIIQPALTILMGGLMLWITIAVFGPIYTHFGDMDKLR